MEDNKIIFPCESNFNSPICIIKRRLPDDTFKYRLVGNYVQLNQITEPIEINMESVKEIIEKGRYSKFFTCIDITKAFLSMPIYPEHCKYTAFTTPNN